MSGGCVLRPRWPVAVVYGSGRQPSPGQGRLSGPARRTGQTAIRSPTDEAQTIADLPRDHCPDHGRAGAGGASTPTGCGSRRSATGRSSCGRSVRARCSPCSRVWWSLRCSAATCGWRCACCGRVPSWSRHRRGRRHSPWTRAASGGWRWALSASSRCLARSSPAAEWETWLYFLNATPFGRADPILGRDIGFYVFTLPLLERVHGSAGRSVAGGGGAGGRATCSAKRSGSSRRAACSCRAARRGTSGVLAALLLLVLGFGAWLQIPQLLTAPPASSTGATYADVHARMPALWVLVGAAVLERRAGALAGVHDRRLWPIAAAAGLYVARVGRRQRLRRRSSSGSSSRRTSRCGRRRSSSTTSRRRARPSVSTASSSGRCRARPT